MLTYGTCVTGHPVCSYLFSIIQICWITGLESIESYWEMLSEYEDGYTLAYSLWEEVEPLYEKLHAFVKARIENYYNINNNSTEIPIYLLGKYLYFLLL